MAVQVPAAMMSGQARPKVLDRFASLAEAMRGAIDYAEHVTPDDAPQILAILDLWPEPPVTALWRGVIR